MSVADTGSGKEGVDALVKEYLLSRGYVKTVAELELEANPDSARPTGDDENGIEADPISGNSSAKGTGPDSGPNSFTSVASVAESLAKKKQQQQSVTEKMLSNVAEDLYVKGISHGDASAYAVGYDAVRTWALDSIDMAKTELLALCFPILVHCFLGMVRLGYEEQAHQFLDMNRQHYMEEHNDEMQALVTVVTKEQLQASTEIGKECLTNNAFVSAALKNKFIVRMSSLAYNLLALFLVQSDLVLITSLINDKICFKKKLTVTGSGSSSSSSSSSSSARMSHGIGTANQEMFESSMTAVVPILVELPGYSPTSATSSSALRFAAGMAATASARSGSGGGGGGGGGGTGIRRGAAGVGASSDYKLLPLVVPGTIPKLQQLHHAPTSQAALLSANIGTSNSLQNLNDDSLYASLVEKIVRPQKVLAHAVAPGQNKRKLNQPPPPLAAAAESTTVAESARDSTVVSLQESIFMNADRLGAFSIEAAVDLHLPQFVGGDEEVDSEARELADRHLQAHRADQSTAAQRSMDVDGDGAGGGNRNAGASSSSSGGGGSRAKKSNRQRGAALDPSVIFATVGNTEESMTCMHINASVTQMVTGHRDSCVRVWRLNPKEKKRLHFGRLLPDGFWTMNDVLPKTRRQVQLELEKNRNRRRRSNSSSSSAAVEAEQIDGQDSDGAQQDGDDGHTGMAMLELRGHSRAVYGVSQDCSHTYCRFNPNAAGGGGGGGGEGRLEIEDSSSRLILSCSADESIRLWDTAVAQCVGKYECTAPAWDVAFGPLGYHFASANQNKTATVYATDRMAPLRLLLGHVSDVNCVTWHGNATLLATGSDDKTVRLWDVRAARSARLLQGVTSPISTVAISPLGNLLAAGSDSGQVYIWDLASARSLAVLTGHRGPVHSLAFNSDSAALASGGADCAVRVWDLSSVHKAQTKLAERISRETSSSSSTAAATDGGGGIGATGSYGTSFHNAAAAAGGGLVDLPEVLLSARHAFYTKYSPLFYLGYTPQNLLYAGGPFSAAAATSSQQVQVGQLDAASASSAVDGDSAGSGGQGNGIGGTGSSTSSSKELSERDMVAALGISRAVQSYR